MKRNNIKAHYKKVTSTFLILLLLLSSLPSCRKFVTVGNPPDALTTNAVFSNDQAATAALLSVYIDMMNDQYGSNGSFACLTMSALGGCSANELQWTQNNTSAPIYQQFSTHALTTDNTYVGALWGDGYKYIYRANAILNNIAASSGMTANGKKVVEGEARFIRAFCYFYLVNLFGDVPLVLQTNYQANMNMARTPAMDVWNQITNDLILAKQMLPVFYPTTERLRPNSAVASALLARTYLYQGRWQDAETEANGIITSGSYGNTLPTLDLVFKKGSPETIWQLQPVRANMNTNEGAVFLGGGSYAIMPNLLSAFETNDNRKSQWIGFTSTGPNAVAYPAKYKVGAGAGAVTEYYVVFRLTEQFLIRSEARAQQGGTKLASAISDLNVVRQRAGLGPINPADQHAMLLAIEKERQVEFFAEWGHRWLDLKRTGRAQAVLKPLSPNNTWMAGSELYPVPGQEILSNPALVQNPGY